MKIRKQKIISAWKFDVRTNKGQPDFVNVTSAMGGPRAIAKPPQSEHEQHPPTFYMQPGDWLLQLKSGTYIQLGDHAAFFLLDQGETDDAIPVS